MTERSTEDLERELAFYRRQCNDLGARVLRMQEEQSRAHREARRSRTAARLLRGAFGLVNVEASDESIGNRMLEIVLDNLVCDRAVILRRDSQRGGFMIVNALGFAHPRAVEDIRRLLGVLGKLVDGGNTVIVIEHNLDVIKTADWLIDMGPEGGSRGGSVLAVGTPEEVALVDESHTGRFLRKILGT